uniref:Uncharacterized protein n=1 Tax=Nelumbo nucifera TaxID=4432 RepID=A0A822YDH1_NELNU|nr:TPA_asm: hypothetical protein HUJ06_009368 [Nelumbo nucifera]
MSLPLGKLTILVGAGVLGSVLAKEGRIADVSDLFSGAFKIVWKQLKRDDSPMSRVSRAKPQNDSLLAQVYMLYSFQSVIIMYYSFKLWEVLCHSCQGDA